jgi:hypothetical protein
MRCCICHFVGLWELLLYLYFYFVMGTVVWDYLLICDFMRLWELFYFELLYVVGELYEYLIENSYYCVFVIYLEFIYF